MLIGVVGDYNPANETHTMLDASLAHAGAEGEWISTDAVPSADELEERFAGIWVAPASPYRSMADACVVNKIDTAPEEGVEAVLESIRSVNPNAAIVRAASPFEVEQDTHEIAGKRVLAIEDGPTLTHGEMTYGAAVLAAKKGGASELVDPRPFAVGSIKETFAKYPHMALGAAAAGFSLPGASRSRR